MATHGIASPRSATTDELNLQTKYHLTCAPAKIHISLRIRAVWSESSLSAFWVPKNAKFFHADNASDCANARTDSSLRKSHMSEGMFSHVAD